MWNKRLRSLQVHNKSTIRTLRPMVLLTYR